MEGPLTPSLFSAVSASKVEGIVCAPEAEDNSSNGSDMLLVVYVGMNRSRLKSKTWLTKFDSIFHDP